MRVSRSVVGSLAGPAVAYCGAGFAVGWLRAATPEAGLVWNAVPAPRVAAWVMALGHGVPLEVRTAIGVTSEEAAASLGRLGRTLGGEAAEAGIAFGFSVLLVPLTLFAVTAVASAWVARRAGVRTLRDLTVLAGTAGVVHGAALGVAARLSRVTRVFEGGIAAEVGFTDATGRLALGVGPAPWTALVVGAAWGAAFAAAGAMTTPALRERLGASTRIVYRGWLTGLILAAGSVAALLAVGGLVAVVTGRAPAPALTALGAALLAGNAVSAALLLAQGVSMDVALDAGPFTGWERMDLLHVGAAGEAAHPALWLLVAVPLAAGVIAGRGMRRSGVGIAPAAAGFGALWGLTMAVLAMLLRVRVLSSFSVGDLALGGGTAVFDPLASLVLGMLWGGVAAGAGAAMAGGPVTGSLQPVAGERST